MAPETSKKKKSKKIIIIAAIIIILGFSLISFIIDMVKQKNATKNDVEQSDKNEKTIDYLKNIDMNDNSATDSPTIIAATYKGPVDGDTIRACIDNDEVNVYLAGVCSADKITGIGMTYRNKAREWINNRFTEGMNIYLEIVNSYTDGSYTAYVYDQKNLDPTSYITFLDHCINAEELLKGYGNVATDSIGTKTEWMCDAVDAAQSSYTGIWDDAESYRVCNYSVPERFVEIETEINNTKDETEDKEKKIKKAKRNKKATESVNNTEG